MKLANFLLTFLIITFFYNLSFPQKENFSYLVNAQSLNGYTGNIITPTPYTSDYKKFSFGLHRFNVGVNYGIINSCEIGINLDLNEFNSFTKENFEQKVSTVPALHAKYHIIKQYPEDNPFDFAAGIYRKNIYLLLSSQLTEVLDSVIGTGVDVNLSEEKKVSYFLSLAKSTKYSYFMVDYKSNSGQTNLGWRVLLSPDVKLDLFLIHVEKIKNVFDNFVFGLTLVS